MMHADAIKDAVDAVHALVRDGYRFRVRRCRDGCRFISEGITGLNFFFKQNCFEESVGWRISSTERGDG